MSGSFEKKDEKEQHRIHVLRTWLREDAVESGDMNSRNAPKKNVSKKQAKRLGNALIDEVMGADVDIVKVDRLTRDGANVNLKDGDGKTVLMWASSYGYKEIVEVLIRGGAKMDLKDKDGWTALIWASSRSETETVEALISSGADVNLKDKNGKNALYHTWKKDTMALLEKAARR